MKFSIIPARYAPYLHSVLRIVAGLCFLEHGTGKILGFPAHLPGINQMPVPLLYFTGLMELIGGALITIGFLTRPVAFVLSGFMAVGFFMIHVAVVGHGVIFPAVNGGDAAVLFCFIFLYLAAAGAGPWSVDKG
jgi:putative oxidoreductase